MFFFLSKAIDFLVMPLSIIIMLMILALFTNNKKWQKRIIMVTIVLTYLTSSTYLVTKALNWWEPRVVQLKNVEGTYDVGILLSGGLIYGKKPFTDLISMGNNGDRVLQTFRLYKAGKIKKILITGTSQDYQMELGKGETRVAADLLVRWGVAPADILFEERARNTRENALFSARILKQKFPNGRYILITSAFHMRRSLGCFQKAGVKTDFFCAAYLGGYNGITFDRLLVPDANAFADFSVLWHELVGYVVYKLTGYA
ncbi:YdcF family protein [Dyadobacter crusticola]|uniref:YdcF family protein n=1 Tax=Dyadobacter crusticola TaxID=292407 RepID=UPI0004E242C6|nr:YdcF family protein [Dyadobacter crusticola]